MIIFGKFMVCIKEKYGSTGDCRADKFWQCYLVTIIAYFRITQITAVLSEKLIVMYVMLFLAVLLIVVIGTINHPNRDMDRSELQAAKWAARLCVLMEVMATAASVVLEINSLYISDMSVAIILCASCLLTLDYIGNLSQIVFGE